MTTTPTHRLTRTVLAGLLLSLWLAPAAFAQGFGNPEMMKERLTTQMNDDIKALTLNADQEVKVRSILEAAIEKRMKAMENRPQERTPESMQAFRASLDEINEATEAELADVLTAEQLTTYKKIQEDRAAQRRGRGPRNGSQ